MKSAHRYRITVEALDENGQPQPREPLTFEAANHDDVLAIVERMRKRSEFEGDEAPAFAIGLKLFSEVMLRHRDLPLFAGFAPHFREFMQTLKKGARAE